MVKPFVEPISLAEPTAADLQHSADLETVRWGRPSGRR